MKIIVLAGGKSPERDVSLSSGALIAKALSENGHEVALVDLWKGTGGKPVCFAAPGKGVFGASLSNEAPDIDRLTALYGEAPVGSGVLEALRSCDLVYPALHGGIGEDGRLQALLECLCIPYAGNPPKGSMAAMDKALSKQLYSAAGVATPRGVAIREGDSIPDGLEYPVVVKPASGGSSVGVSFAENRSELEKALKIAFAEEKTAIVERKITGREFSSGVVCGHALPPIEIVPRKGFYDYKNKYGAGLTDEYCPADISEAEDRAIRTAALAAHEALGLSDLSRSDFIMEKNGAVWCLETNSMPGMTPLSLLPKEAAAEGIGYNALCEMLVASAAKRFGISAK